MVAHPPTPTPRPAYTFSLQPATDIAPKEPLAFRGLAPLIFAPPLLEQSDFALVYEGPPSHWLILPFCNYNIIPQVTRSSRQVADDQNDWSNISAVILIKKTSLEDFWSASLLRYSLRLVSRQAVHLPALMCVAADVSDVSVPVARDLQFLHDHFSSSLSDLLRKSGTALAQGCSHIRLLSSIR